MKRDILTDNMSPKGSVYRFRTVEVKRLIKTRGGLETVAAALRTTVRTLYRTITNESLNGRLQRDLVQYLRVPSGRIGYLATDFPEPDVVKPQPTEAPSSRGQAVAA